MFPVLYSPNETEHFLGFFTSWIRIQIQEAYLYADPDPKHWFAQQIFEGSALDFTPPRAASFQNGIILLGGKQKKYAKKVYA